ncbi:MAG: P-loop NTPase [Candidatus Aminicenantes bacterium]|nr:P-loop NTPase [Candidatus Aminicenantes bacterium]
MIITCYSYKGGSGRSTAAVNIAGSLFRKGKKVACLDMDFGAPGMHEILKTTGERGEVDVWEPINKAIDSKLKQNDGTGIHHFFNKSVSDSDFVNKYGINFKKLVYKNKLERQKFIGMKEDFEHVNGAEKLVKKIKEGELIFLTASGKEKSVDLISGKHYDLESFKDRFCLLVAELVNFFHKKTGDGKKGKPLDRDTFDKFYNDIYIICDSASGITANSLPVLNTSNMILTFFRWSAQHLKGTEETCRVLKYYLEERYVFGKVRLYKVGSIKPSIEPGRGKLFNDVVFQKAKKNIDSNLDKLKSDIDFKYLGDIPEDDSMKFFERIVTLSEAYEFYKELVDSYDSIAERVIMERRKIDDSDIRNKVWKKISDSK